MPENHLLAGLATHFRPDQLARLANARVGIAGAGGLGSNLAIMLCRCGIGGLILVDHDNVEPSNLNRQHFLPGQLGMPKVEALAENLLALNPDLELDIRNMRLDADNIDSCIRDCTLWAEALDGAEDKTMLVEKALLASCQIVSASGLCGYGGPPMQKRRMGNLVLVGDFTTSCQIAPPLAPRVTQAAALMADAILEFVLGEEEKPA